MLFKKKFISIFESKEGLAYSVQAVRRAQCTILETQFLDYPANLSFEDKIKDLPHEKLLGVVYTVRPEDYQLFQIKKPMVDKKEIENAILWTVQDKIFFGQDDYILSHFPCEKIGPAEELFVVAFKKSAILANLDALKKRYQWVISLKIPELSAIGLCKANTQDTFIFYLESSMGKDSVHVVRNQKLLKTLVSPVTLGEKPEESSTLTLHDSIQSLMRHYNMKTFEVRLAASLPKKDAWQQTLAPLLPGKVFIEDDFIGLSDTSHHNNVALAVGGGLAYAKEKV